MSVKVTLNIADDTYQHAKQLAQQRQQGVAELLADAITLPNERHNPTREEWQPLPLLDAHLARRKVNGWLVTNVGSLLAQEPQLMQLPEGRTIWRFKAYLTGATHPPQGPVGAVDVDAYSGELLTNEHATNEITAKATALALAASSSKKAFE